MTRKDFQLIAEVLTQADETERIEATVERFADRLATTNPNFDRDRFVAVATGKRER